MFWLTLRDALNSLWSSKQRTLLATAGIVIGSGSVIAMINVGQMVQAEALAQFERMGPNTITMRFSGQRASVTAATIEAMVEQVPGIVRAAPATNAGGTWYFEGIQGNTSMMGTVADTFAIARTELAEGRYVTAFDKSEMYVVVGHDAFDTYDGRPVQRARVGDEVRIGTSVFEVIGVLEPYGSNPLMGISFDRTLFIPLMAARRLGSSGRIESAVLQSEPEADVSEVSRQAELFVRAQAPGADVEIQVAEQLIESMKQQTRLLSLLLGTMGSISLLVGGIGIMNVMLVAVTERKREIGLRLAVGATPGNIVSLFMVESALLTTIGGLLGLSLGAGGAYALSQIADVPYFFSTIAAVLGVGVSAAVGLFFGYYPAHLASRLNPIDGLNSE